MFLWCGVWKDCLYDSESCNHTLHTARPKGHHEDSLAIAQQQNTRTQRLLTRTHAVCKPQKFTAPICSELKDRETEPQSHRLKLTPLFIERNRRECARKKDRGFWGGWISTDRKREKAGVNVKVDHCSLLFIVLLISEWLSQVNRYHYRPLCRTERETLL